MKKRQFNKIIKSISTHNKLDLEKIKELPDEIKTELIYFIVRNRGPIVKELIPVTLDNSWLASCGYLYETRGQDYIFVHLHGYRII